MKATDLHEGDTVEVWLPYGAGEGVARIVDTAAMPAPDDRPYPGTVSENVTVRVEWLEDGSYSIRRGERMRVRPRDIQRRIPSQHEETP